MKCKIFVEFFSRIENREDVIAFLYDWMEFNKCYENVRRDGEYVLKIQFLEGGSLYE